MQNVPGFTINDRGRAIPNARAGEPFYCFAMGGKAARNGHLIEKPGWYFVDAANNLHGPYASKRAAKRMVK